MAISKYNKLSLFQTPVLLLVFNRPDTVQKVFKKICEIKPKKLYIASDGPREGNHNDIEKISQVREIVSKVNWPCKINSLFRDKNLGCKKSVSDAINWFFANEEQGIILEDDCVPHLDFFNFCENLLNHYAEDERVIVITGNNFQNGKLRGNASYYFSKYNHCWGWASWRRAWKNYEGEIKFWPKWNKSDVWLNLMHDKVERKYWKNIFDSVYEGKIDSWAYPWLASAWYVNGLTATPNVNLVSNIGFGNDATHTKSKKNKYSKLKSHNLKKIKHSNNIQIHVEADKYTSNYFFGIKKLRFPYNILNFPYRLIGYIFRSTINILKMLRK